MHDQTISGTDSEQTVGAAVSFADLVKAAEPVSRLLSQGYQSPTPLQCKMLPLLNQGKDIVVTGNRGSGKTISWALHLAALVSEKQLKGAVVVVGSLDNGKQVVEKLAMLGVPARMCGTEGEGIILVGTPDLLLEAVNNKELKKINVVVLDEIADTLTPQALSMVEGLLEVIQNSGTEAQHILVGKMMSFSLAGLVKRFFKAPEQVDITSEGDSNAEVINGYYEVSGDLLAKPSLLCDIIEADTASIVIFCNTPSDSDFVEVMLKKRNIPGRKLIGNVPSFKMDKAVEELASGEIRALIVTDVSAKSLEIEGLDVIVNYSIPSDPEIYIHRLGRSGKGGKQHRILSLVGPLDRANFHYLKKFVEFPFSKLEAPSAPSATAATLRTLEQKASGSTALQDDNIRQMVELVLASSSRDLILGYLVHLSMQPQARAQNLSSTQAGERSDRRDRGDYEDRGDRGRDNRSERAPARGDRNDRGDRNARPDNRADRNNWGERNDRGDRGPANGRFPRRDEGDVGEGPSSGAQLNSNEGFSDEGNRRPRRERPMTPPKRSIRVYIGHGTSAGMDEKKLRETLASTAGVTETQINRVQLRPAYSFVDFPEADAEGIITKLKDAGLTDGQKLFSMKATVISEPRPESSSNDEQSFDQDREPRGARDSETAEQTGGAEPAFVEENA